MNGILNVLKPPGMTSSDVVVYLRNNLKIRKAGHTGTLGSGSSWCFTGMFGKSDQNIRLYNERNKNIPVRYETGHYH